jgi:hypothetical protein
MTIELAQSFDIDKIDGLGAVGVARLFVMSGKYANSIYYNPIGSTNEFVLQIRNLKGIILIY